MTETVNLDQWRADLSVEDADLVDRIAERAHDEWVADRNAAGFASPLWNGLPLQIPFSQLSERMKLNIRTIARRHVQAIVDLGFTLKTKRANV